MANFNKVILAGNLTRDPELRYTPKGTAIAKFGLAINRTWKTETGEAKEEVTFVDVDSFGRQAEVIAQYMKKGRPLLVGGRLRLDQWDDKQTGLPLPPPRLPPRRNRRPLNPKKTTFLSKISGREADSPPRNTQHATRNFPHGKN